MSSLIFLMILIILCPIVWSSYRNYMILQPYPRLNALHLLYNLLQKTINTTTYFVFTKAHHFDKTTFWFVYDVLIKLRDLIINENPEETDLAISDLYDPFSKLSYTKIYNMIAYVFHNTKLKIYIYKNQPHPKCSRFLKKPWLSHS